MLNAGPAYWTGKRLYPNSCWSYTVDCPLLSTVVYIAGKENILLIDTSAVKGEALTLRQSSCTHAISKYIQETILVA